MTSSNTINYTIYNKQGEKVGSHSQNIMCSTCNDGLENFQPAIDFKIQPWGYDEEEEEWCGEKQNLDIWLQKNKASITFKNFEINTKVKLKKERVEGLVIESYKGKWLQEYTIKLSNGDLLENVNQTNLMKL
jgi:hypothetical protein